MKLAIAGTLLVAIAVVPTAVMSADDKAVTITGCLLKGDKGGYVMTNVAEISGAGMANRVIYWLSGAGNLDEHVGHKIAVGGTIKLTEGGEVEVDPAKRSGQVGTSIQVEARGRSIETTTTDPAKVPQGGKPDGKTEKEIKMPAYKLKVKDIRMLAATCP